MSAHHSQGFYFGPCHSPTTHTSLTHLEDLPDTPLLGVVVDAVLDSQIRASLTATKTGNAFLRTAHRRG